MWKWGSRVPIFPGKWGQEIRNPGSPFSWEIIWGSLCENCQGPPVWLTIFPWVWGHLSRGSHFYVLGRSICDWDQNWIRKEKPFLGAHQGIKVISELLKSTDQGHAAAVWPLTLENQAITSEGNDQAIKHTGLYQSKKKLNLVANASTGNIQVTTPCLYGSP